MSLTEKEIREYEERGLNVVKIGSDGKLEYATNKNLNTDYCDSCEFLKFEPDPDPDDWFRDGDEKAICTKLDAQIAGALEPRELTNIYKPLWCPKLGRKLTPKEQKEAEERLDFDTKIRNAPR